MSQNASFGGTQARSSPELGQLLYQHRVRFQAWMIIAACMLVPVGIGLFWSQRDMPVSLFFGLAAVLALLPVGLWVQERRLSRDVFFFHERGFRWIVGSKERVILYHELRQIRCVTIVLRYLVLQIKKEAIGLVTAEGESIQIRYRHPPRMKPRPGVTLDPIRDILASAIAEVIIAETSKGHSVPWCNGLSIVARGLQTTDGTLIEWLDLSFDFMQGRCMLGSRGAKLLTLPLGGANVFPVLIIARRNSAAAPSVGNSVE
jgi:hypothetical protein